MSVLFECGHGCVVGYSQDPECPVHGDPDLAFVLTDLDVHLVAFGRAHFIPLESERDGPRPSS